MAALVNAVASAVKGVAQTLAPKKEASSELSASVVKPPTANQKALANAKAKINQYKQSIKMANISVPQTQPNKATNNVPQTMGNTPAQGPAPGSLNNARLALEGGRRRRRRHTKKSKKHTRKHKKTRRSKH